MNLKPFIYLTSSLFLFGCQSSTPVETQPTKPELNVRFESQDIENFWYAYDQVQNTDDSATQIKLFQSLFIDHASEGQKAMMDLRRYTVDQYVSAIRKYPKYWASIRTKMMKAESFKEDIKAGVIKLNEIYPLKNNGNVYFTVGVFRSPGTTLDSLVLIGSEFAFGDTTVHTDEFPENMGYVKNYYQSNPIEKLTFLNIHEFIHTQQSSAINTNLLSQCLREGIAELVAELASNTSSKEPSIVFGKANDLAIKEAFEKDIFKYNYGYWLWNNIENPFGQRDLGYYAGYAIAKKYYDNSTNKSQAIKTLIELDFANEKDIVTFANDVHHFDQDILESYAIFNQKRPKVVSIEGLENNTDLVDPNLKEIAVTFDRPMHPQMVGFDYGPLGEEHVLRINEVLGYSEDGKTIRLSIELQPSQELQVKLTQRFSDQDGYPLQPHLISIKTKEG